MAWHAEKSPKQARAPWARIDSAPEETGAGRVRSSGQPGHQDLERMLDTPWAEALDRKRVLSQCSELRPMQLLPCIPGCSAIFHFSSTSCQGRLGPVRERGLVLVHLPTTSSWGSRRRLTAAPGSRRRGQKLTSRPPSRSGPIPATPGSEQGCRRRSAYRAIPHRHPARRQPALAAGSPSDTRGHRMARRVQGKQVPSAPGLLVTFRTVRQKGTSPLGAASAGDWDGKRFDTQAAHRP